MSLGISRLATEGDSSERPCAGLTASAAFCRRISPRVPPPNWSGGASASIFAGGAVGGAAAGGGGDDGGCPTA
jgi:hypothetical protein